MKAGPRRRAREAALQALYFCQVGGAEPDAALPLVFEAHWPDAAPAARAFADALVRGAVADAAALDERIAKQSAHWRLERIAVIDRLILRMAVWELQHCPDTPAAVVLNEAIELAKTFGAEDSVRFVNGVLDGIRRSLGGEAP